MYILNALTFYFHFLWKYYTFMDNNNWLKRGHKPYLNNLCPISSPWRKKNVPNMPLTLNVFIKCKRYHSIDQPILYLLYCFTVSLLIWIESCHWEHVSIKLFYINHQSASQWHIYMYTIDFSKEKDGEFSQ
jgi:hypothetical protein